MMNSSVTVLAKTRWHCSLEHVVICGEYAIATDDDCQGSFFDDPSAFAVLTGEDAHLIALTVLLDRPDSHIYRCQGGEWERVESIPASVRGCMEAFAVARSGPVVENRGDHVGN